MNSQHWRDFENKDIHSDNIRDDFTFAN